MLEPLVYKPNMRIITILYIFDVLLYESIFVPYYYISFTLIIQSVVHLH